MQKSILSLGLTVPVTASRSSSLFSSMPCGLLVFFYPFTQCSPRLWEAVLPRTQQSVLCRIVLRDHLQLSRVLSAQALFSGILSLNSACLDLPELSPPPSQVRESSGFSVGFPTSAPLSEILSRPWAWASMAHVIFFPSQRALDFVA